MHEVDSTHCNKCGWYYPNYKQGTTEQVFPGIQNGEIIVRKPGKITCLITLLIRAKLLLQVLCGPTITDLTRGLICNHPT
jgi:hypothetical protein